MTEQTPELEQDVVEEMPTDIWLTPEIVQRIIEANEIFEDIENELSKE